MVFGLREHFSHGLQYAKILVTNNEFHAIQTTATQPPEEADLSGLVLFHALSGTQNLTVSIHIDIRIPPALQRSVTPILNVDIRLLVQLTDDGRGRHFTSPQSLSNVFHMSNRYACQVHLNEILFHAAFSAVIPLNDDCFERESL